MSRTATCVRGACYQSEGAWRDPRAGGGARLALAGAAIACGARVRACGAFRKLLLDGGVSAAVIFQRYRVGSGLMADGRAAQS